MSVTCKRKVCESEDLRPDGYCGGLCKARDNELARQRAERSLVKRKACHDCGDLFIAKGTTRYCVPCVRDRRAGVRIITCVGCGVDFKGPRLSKWCGSAPCMQAKKRKENQRYRRRRKGSASDGAGSRGSRFAKSREMARDLIDLHRIGESPLIARAEWDRVVGCRYTDGNASNRAFERWKQHARKRGIPLVAVDDENRDASMSRSGNAPLTYLRIDWPSALRWAHYVLEVIPERERKSLAADRKMLAQLRAGRIHA